MTPPHAATAFPFPPPSGPASEPRIAQALADGVAKLAAAEGSLLVCDDRAGDLVFAVSVGPHAHQLAGLRRSIDDGLVGLAASFGQAQISNAVAIDPGFDPGVDQEIGSTTRSMLAVPVVTPEGVVAVLTALNREGGFAADHLAYGQALAKHLADLWTHPDTPDKPSLSQEQQDPGG